MKGEIPVFRRCCFCVPLRYGLLAWGYFKMIADAFLIWMLSYSLISTYIREHKKGNDSGWIETEIIVSVLFGITVLFTDLIVSIVFIVGGHKKNVKLIKVFYIFNMGLWVASFLLAVAIISITIKQLIEFHIFYWSSTSIISIEVGMIISFYFVVLAVQFYFLLLLRSEIIKLRNNGEFKFVNNAVEAECTMKCEDRVVGIDTVKQDV